MASRRCADLERRQVLESRASERLQMDCEETHLASCSQILRLGNVRSSPLAQVALVFLVALVGCGGGSRSLRGPSPLLGPWTIDLLVATQSDSPSSQSTARLQVRGTIQFTESNRQVARARSQDQEVLGEWAIDFVPLLGRIPTCNGQYNSAVAWIDSLTDSVHVTFSGRSSHCGFWIDGEVRGDTIAGIWRELGQVGPTRVGSARLIRVKEGR